MGLCAGCRDRGLATGIKQMPLIATWENPGEGSPRKPSPALLTELGHFGALPQTLRAFEEARPKLLVCATFSLKWIF